MAKLKIVIDLDRVKPAQFRWHCEYPDKEKNPCEPAFRVPYSGNEIEDLKNGWHLGPGGVHRAADRDYSFCYRCPKHAKDCNHCFVLMKDGVVVRDFSEDVPTSTMPCLWCDEDNCNHAHQMLCDQIGDPGHRMCGECEIHEQPRAICGRLSCL